METVTTPCPSREPEFHRNAVMEFLAALRNPLTYSPLLNTEVIFGFLWGLPIPFFVLLIHAYAAGLPWTFAALWDVDVNNPLYIFFFLHPLLFAAVFGALGTMRAHRELRIQGLLQQVKLHCEELERANHRLEELDRLKSEFLANVTHELKSPLVTSLGYTDRMLMGHLGDVNEKQKRGLEVSKRNLTRLRTLIDEILDFSKLESGMANFHMEPTTLNAAIQAAVESASLKARDRRINIDVESPAAPAAVRGDASKLLQLVVNLLDNAIKFSPEDSRILIKVEPIDGMWRLSVIDNGCGIPAEKMPQLFQRFFQVDGSLGRVHEGFGLGLVIVRKIVEGHGGKVWVESRTGSNSGTSIILELPKVDASLPGCASPVLQDTEKEVANAANTNH